MTDEEFALLLGLGAEQRNVQLKGPGPISDKHLVHKVARAILGMTNRLDGGFVIVGVNESSGTAEAIGVDQDTISDWTRDALADKLAPLVDPSVDFNLEHRAYDGHNFVLITVREFDEHHILRSDKHDPTGKTLVLREGALYVRGRRKPETVEIRTSQEMRDLLALSLRKRLRHFMELLQSAGGITSMAIGPSDADRFQSEIADMGLDQ